MLVDQGPQNSSFAEITGHIKTLRVIIRDIVHSDLAAGLATSNCPNHVDFKRQSVANNQPVGIIKLHIHHLSPSIGRAFIPTHL